MAQLTVSILNLILQVVVIVGVALINIVQKSDILDLLRRQKRGHRARLEQFATVAVRDTDGVLRHAGSLDASPPRERNA